MPGAEEQLIVDGPLHRNEPTALWVIKDIEQRPIPGVLPCPVPHKDCTGGADEPRFLGTSELGEHFGGNPNSADPEDLVAAQMEADLQAVPHWMGIDVHDSPMDESNYIMVGETTSPEQLGLAIALG